MTRTPARPITPQAPAGYPHGDVPTCACSRGAVSRGGPDGSVRELERVRWWLAERSRYGYAAKLVDGPHDEREGAEEALYLYRRLGYARAECGYVVVRVEQWAAEERSEGVDEEALDVCVAALRAARGGS